MNKIILKGRLTAVPEIRYSQGNESIAVAKFSIAVSRGYKKDNKDITDFINCTAFRKTAEFIGKYFKKGQEILAEGQLHIDTYETNGEKKKSIYVNVTSVEFCGSKENGASNGVSQNSGTANNTSDKQEDSYYSSEDITDEDDLPC